LALTLNEPSLSALSEDSLYTVISNHFDDNVDRFSLLEFIHFEFLSISCIEHFIHWTQIHSFELSKGIWERLCIRLALNFHHDIKSRVASSIDCRFKPDTPRQGIIAYSTTQFHGNVSVTSKSVSSDGYAA
jgi:hypothetical protein